MIEITRGFHIREEDLVFEASRSSGPGGQNVNKVSSRISVLFDIGSCSYLSAERKALLFRRLRSRLTGVGILRVTSQKHRSQAANRQAAVDRLAELLRDALTERPARKTTQIPHNAKLRRRHDKTRRSLLKKLRTAAPLEQ